MLRGSCVLHGACLFGCSNNQLRDVPPELGHLTTLNSLLLDGNPIKAIRRTLLMGGTPALLKYLRSRCDDYLEQAQDAQESLADACRTGTWPWQRQPTCNMTLYDIPHDMGRSMRAAPVFSASASAFGALASCADV